jgi:hypothetical protein
VPLLDVIRTCCPQLHNLLGNFYAHFLVGFIEFESIVRVNVLDYNASLGRNTSVEVFFL